MGSLSTIDGDTVPLEHATVGVLDRGLLYGDSVFETLRTYGGAPFLLERHVERLARSAAVVGIDIRVENRVIEDEVLSTLREASNEDSYVRITVTRGSGEPGLDPSLSSGARRIVVVIPLKPPSPDLYEKGIRAITVSSHRTASASPAKGAKTGNYLENVLALRSARERGASDALFVEADGRIIQGSSSNVFFVAAGALVTPPVEDGILAGVTREAVLGIAGSLGIRVETRSPRVSELGSFDEVFLSSSIRELAPVVAIDALTIGAGNPGPMCARLLDAYRAAALGDRNR